MYKVGIDDQKPDSCVLHQGFNLDVDFCIWVLEVDGLQVPEFDKHHPGNGVLRASGMDAESWQFWVKRVVLLSDQRLNWRVENSQTELSTTLASMESATSEASMRYPQLNIPSVDNPALVGATWNYIVWKEQHYHQAASAARLVYKESEYPTWCPLPPPELWDGDSRVRELLQELWQQYFHTVSSIRQEEFLLRQPRSSRTSGIGLYDLLKPYHKFTSRYERRVLLLHFWNLFNAKCFGLKQSAFSNISQNKVFLVIASAILLGQILIVQFGGRIFRTVPLSFNDWLIMIAGISVVLWFGELIRLNDALEVQKNLEDNDVTKIN